MTWADKLRRVKMPDGRILIGASYRGVPFFVDDAERGGGRRVVVHEFPLRDDPFVEDMGRQARTFHISGYVLGDDYISQRDDVLSALEDTAGPGELVHPYYGVKTVICTKYSVHEAKMEGGVATFSLDFQEAPLQAPVPVALADLAGAVATSADTADAATDAEFAAQYDPDNLPAFALASAQSAIESAAEAMKDKLSSVIDATQEAADLTSQVSIIVAETSSLVREPGAILGSFRDAIAALETTIVDAPTAVMNALIAAYSVDLGAPPTPTTATRAREAANLTALSNGLRRVFAIQAARLAPSATFDSTDSAIATRDTLVALLDAEAEAADDTAYDAIVDLRAQVMRAVPGNATFARITTVTRPVPIPSILLAYQLYGSTELEADVIARNGIRHPGFVAGDLKVLSDG